MSKPSIDNPCPACGQPRDSLEAACANCQWRPKEVRSPALVQARATISMLLEAMRTVSINSLLLITALVAFCCSILMVAPWLGAFVLSVSVLALGRTALFALHCKAHGQPLSMDAKVLAFLQSCLFVCLVLMASCTTFVATCLPTAIAFRVPSAAWLTGIVCATLLLFGLLWIVPVYRPKH